MYEILLVIGLAKVEKNKKGKKNICYKTNKECLNKCKGLCKDSY